MSIAARRGVAMVASLLLCSCDNETPMSSHVPGPATAAKTVTNPVASTCEVHPCRPGFELLLPAPENTQPVVVLVQPDVTGSGVVDGFLAIEYVLYDADNDAGTIPTESLKMELYFHPDSGLSTVDEVRNLATLIVDERDSFLQGDPPGTGDFKESLTSTNVQRYTWTETPTGLQEAFGFRALTATPDGDYFVYIVADDGVNPPVFDVSSGVVQVVHGPEGVPKLAPFPRIQLTEDSPSARLDLDDFVLDDGPDEDLFWSWMTPESIEATIDALTWELFLSATTPFEPGLVELHFEVADADGNRVAGLVEVELVMPSTLPPPQPLPVG